MITTEKIKGIFQDFRGGLTDEQLENAAYAMIHNIANLRDHLRRWAAQFGRDKNRVDEIFASSFELQEVTDLWNIAAKTSMNRKTAVSQNPADRET